MFEDLYKKIVEEEEDIFKASTPEEGKRRQQEFKKMQAQEWVDDLLSTSRAKKNLDGTYDLYGDIVLGDRVIEDMRTIPIKINKVHGDFYCNSNLLTTLEGSPKEVEGQFSAKFNHLTDLEGSPAKVGENFFCSFNKLTSLKGAPKEVGGNFLCYHNPKRFTKDEVRAVCNVKGKIYNSSPSETYV